MNLLTLIDQFLTDAIAFLAPLSRKSYGSHLRAFAAFAGPRARLDAFCRAALERYDRDMAEQHKRPRTRKGFMSAARRFGSWLVTEGYLPTNPAAELRAPRLDSPTRELPTQAQAADLLAACDRFPDPRRAALARCAVSLLLYAGVEVSCWPCVSAMCASPSSASPWSTAKARSRALSRSVTMP